MKYAALYELSVTESWLSWLLWSRHSLNALEYLNKIMLILMKYLVHRYQSQ